MLHQAIFPGIAGGKTDHSTVNILPSYCITWSQEGQANGRDSPVEEEDEQSTDVAKELGSDHIYTRNLACVLLLPKPSGKWKLRSGVSKPNEESV